MEQNKKFLLKLKIKLVALRRFLGWDKFIRPICDWYEKRANNHRKQPVKPALPGWSIVVVTGGLANETLNALVKSIQEELFDSPAELIIVGPKTVSLDFSPLIDTRHILYKELGLVPGWITRKKNIGVSFAKYDKVAVCHDYIFFAKGWKDGYEKFGDNFEVCVNKIINKDGERFRDWITWDYPEVGVGLLPYDVECSQYQIVSGTYFVVKRDFYLQNPLNEKLRWGEAEDIEWSMRLREKVKFKFNPHSSVRLSRLKKGTIGAWFDGTEKLNAIFENHEKNTADQSKF